MRSSLHTVCASSLTVKSQGNDELVQALANGCLLVYNELNEFVLRFWRVLLELKADLWVWGVGEGGGQCSGVIEGV